ncbi:lipase family protein [Marilutibacter alkalisoli]|uniref:lipase family protein n=1 Tax=Marilutibacter alkalisoli TaxID=2591633 RepID=UPI001ABE1243|nr:lipase [Lysobacter alkalisoli]
MKPTSQQYADLADHCYDRDGNLAQLASAKEEVEIGGVTYKVVDHLDNPRTGYQGTIYQQVDSGAIVVAHRGTEPDRDFVKDIIAADAGMVLTRNNLQVDDAIALTRRAKEYANNPEFVAQYGQAPEVSVTGHSLGGTLAQVTAHHFDLRGETFNAYGAVSLNLRIPEGGDKVLNHVMATDVVSSGSPHYGQVRHYALPEEVTRLHQSGYHDNRFVDALVGDMPIAAAMRSFGSHNMHHFLDVDGEGRPDVSILRNPEARRLADQHSRMIEDYRGDVEGIRRGITRGARGPGGLLQDGVDWLRGPVEAGEPAAREAREQASREAREAARARPGQGVQGSGLFDSDGPLKWPESLPRTDMGGPPLRPSAAAEATARLDRLLAGEFDPAAREAWDRDVAMHRQRMEPVREQEVLQAQQSEQAGLAR